MGETGIEIGEGLAEFLKRFLEDPEIFFTLTTAERRKIEGDMQTARLHFNGSNKLGLSHRPSPEYI